MSTAVSAVEQAFADLEQAPAEVQGLLRPVLVRALHDQPLMRQLAASALSEHLFVLGRVLMSLPSEGMGPPMPPLKTFLQFIIGEDVDDAEEAYDYVRTLDEPLRARVERGLTRALRTRTTRSGEGTISLLALARLMALAFSNMPSVTHILDGGEVERFLPQGSERISSSPKATSRAQTRARRRPEASASSSQLGHFLGAFVEIISVANQGEPGTHSGQMFMTIGRVVEISASYVILDPLRGHGSDVPIREKLLLGMNHIVAMRLISSQRA